jgi:hypothetical protein
VTSKEGYYEAMIRNLYFLPPIKNSLVTIEWMNLVRAGTIPCPRFGQVNHLPCPTPPSHELIVSEVKRATGSNMGITSPKKYPCVQWCLRVLSTFEPDHEFFAKDYHPPVNAAKSRRCVENSDGFFSGLPSSGRGKIKRASRVIIKNSTKRPSELVKA